MLRLDAIAKHYNNVRALEPTDLSVEEGEFLTLLGPSGSGKTTLLNLISGRVSPSSGRIFIDGRDVTDEPASKRGLGMVFQNYALLPHLSIFENVAYPLRVRGLASAEIKKKVGEALELVCLGGVANRRPIELSGGQQQRIAIARCLVYRPALVLMDEPLGALDKKLRDQMQLEIRRLHSELRFTVIYVTHDQAEALVMSDRICLLNNGRIEQLDTPRGIYFSPRTVFAADFLGESNILKARHVASHRGRELAIEGGLRVRMAAGEHERCEGETLIMIRPESIMLTQGSDEQMSAGEGVVEDIIMIGGVTEFRVRLADDVTIAARVLTSNSGRYASIGESVKVSIHRADIALIPESAHEAGTAHFTPSRASAPAWVSSSSSRALAEKG